MTSIFNSVRKFVIPSFLLVCGFRLSYGFIQPTELHSDLHLGSSVTASNGCKGNEACEDQFTESDCILYGICSLSCGYRDTYPAVAVLSSTTDCQGDSPALPPAAIDESHGHIFINSSTNTDCTVNTTVSADGDTGNFGISLWIQGSCSANCTVLYGVDMSTPLILDIVEDSLYLSGQSLSSWPRLSPDDWLHVVITKRINNSVDLYINNSKQLFLAELTDSLQGVTAVLGSVSALTDNDTVTVWDARFYSDGLTDREIEGLYTGIFPPANHVSSCRCPASYPHISSAGFTCSSGSDTVGRLRKVFHEPSVLLDELSTTSWVSTGAGDVQIVVDLGNSFQINNVTVIFKTSSASPAASVWVFGPRGQTGSVDTSLYSHHNTSLNYGNTSIKTYWDFEKTVAEKIVITFRGRSASDTIPNYIIEGITVSGWCDCDGAARTCTKTSGSPSYTCDCQPDSEPPNCRNCSKGIFREENGFGCFTTCSCYRPGVNTSDICESVGEHCKCKANVVGPRCNLCKHLTYNLQSDNDEGCTRSPCNETGTDSYDDRNSTCKCKENVIGDNCTMCEDKHYGIGFRSGCYPCDCDISGTLKGDDTCDLQSGQCNCKAKTKGRKCNECPEGFYNLTAGNNDGCSPCDCFTNGTVNANTLCDMDAGNCPCKSFVQGRQCDECLDGFFNFDPGNDEGCSPCDCNVNGTVDASLTCDQANGNCSCKSNVQGRYCDQCYDGFYNLDAENIDGCSPCDCNTNGTINATDTCNNVTGECDCKRNVQGRQCDTCSDGFYDLDLGNDEGCSSCNCTTDGTLDGGDTCNTTGHCDCKPNVQGRQCGDCKDGFFRLEAGEGLGCSTTCDCDTSGTVNATTTCDMSTGNCSCKSNVQGPKCATCVIGYYNLDTDNDDGCSPCGCDISGSMGDACDETYGNCSCKVNVEGTKCDQCKNMTYDLSPSYPGGCTNCACDEFGTESCDNVTGSCNCHPNVTGISCDGCEVGHYGIESGSGCSPCECNINGTVGGSDLCILTNGNCYCKTYVKGRQCDQCITGYFDLDLGNVDGCSPCQCNTTGTVNSADVCDFYTGECSCKSNVEGKKCDACSDGFYNMEVGIPGGCLPCDCNTDGTVNANGTCDIDGNCTCKTFVQGRQCDQCVDGYYDLDSSNDDGCSPCQCNTNGTTNGADGCHFYTGQCQCKRYVQGLQCDECKDGSYNFDGTNTDGCTLCDCNAFGRQTQTCDKVTGICECKVNTEGDNCDLCKNMTYNLSPSKPEGCTNCACDEFGTESCDNVTGSCNCHPNVTGSRCDRCVNGYYGIDSGSGCRPCRCDVLNPPTDCEQIVAVVCPTADPGNQPAEPLGVTRLWTNNCCTE